MHLSQLTDPPRLKAAWPALGFGVVLAAAVTVLLAGGGSPASIVPEEQRAAVALFLYGQDDPDTVVARGFHGLGGTPQRITIRQLDQCRFDLVAAGQHETIDFGRITTIRHTTMLDPAAGLTRSLGQGGRGPLTRLSVVILAGEDDAICADEQCSGGGVFALSDPARLEAARLAAAEFRRRCHGVASPAPAKAIVIPGDR